MTTEPFAGWAILELMGHRQRPGYVQEVEIAGGKMLRVDIPAPDGEVTEYYGASALYCIRPVSEEIARDKARGANSRPPRPLEYAALPPASTSRDDDEEEF